jgi:hypothetical protein
MKVSEFIGKLQNIFNNFRTVYMWGVFGAPVTEALIAAKAKQYPSWYTSSKQASLRKLIGKGYFGFDCIGLIKAVLWSWYGSSSKSYGGCEYNSNGVPDVSADGMLSKLINVSTNFSNIVPGEAVWMEGHIGIYIGNGKVIECSPKWANGVQITACLNVKTVSGLNGRTWTKHGKLPYIEYEAVAPAQKPSVIPYREKVLKFQKACNLLGITDENGDKLEEDGKLGDHTKAARKKANAVVRRGDKNALVGVVQYILGIKIDNSYGASPYHETYDAVGKFQKDHDLEVDHNVGPITWLELLSC